MLMPALSVTAIGLLVTVVLIAAQWLPSARAALGAVTGAVAGAWAGYILGAATGNGYFLALLGHAAAIPGALVGVRRLIRPAVA
jgi:outer membrane lipoprotein SlyB